MIGSTACRRLSQRRWLGVMLLIRLSRVLGRKQTHAGFWLWEIVRFCKETALMMAFSRNLSKLNSLY